MIQTNNVRKGKIQSIKFMEGSYSDVSSHGQFPNKTKNKTSKNEYILIVSTEGGPINISKYIGVHM